jgi:hypothetical protein
MGYLVNPVSGTIITYSYSLTDADLLTMGSIPINLTFDTGSSGSYVYIPLNAFFMLNSGTTPYDFGSADHPVIQQGLTYNIFQWYEPLQNYASAVDLAFATLAQRINANTSHATAINYKYIVPNFQLTTNSGNDATVGDQKFTLYITAYKVTL